MSHSSLRSRLILKPSTQYQHTPGESQDDCLPTRVNFMQVAWHSFAAAWEWSGRYAIVATNAAMMIAYFTILRTVMLIAFVDLSEFSVQRGFSLFLVGFRFDVLVALCFVLPQMLHVTVVSNRRICGFTSRFLLAIEYLIAFLFPPLLCIAEYIFFFEFQSRLNYIAFEYIIYPTEVCCNIWQSYPIFNLISLAGVSGGMFWLLLRKTFRKRVSVALPWKRRYGFLATFFAVIALLWTTTGADSRQISRNRIANECAWNGLYSVVYYAWTCNFDFNLNYITLDESEAFQRLQQQVVGREDRLKEGSNNPVDRIVTGRSQHNYNVVLILEESLGSDFIGVLGDDRGLTPRFDELTREGILFDNFYATGNRTARALEAVLTSMPPIPTESILKRDHSNRVFTLANVLAERGYDRLFMTAGRGLFDGVRSFMKANGFNRFLEQSDFRDPVFSNAWGVSDEDLFGKALDELDGLHASGRPFFATLLTVSNHRPYTFPEGRISDNSQSRENAVRYADWALGDFFKKARQHDFYRNTIFVVMGDHGARVYGSQLFPMRSYRIPVLMILPDSERRETRCSTLACSLDIAPTIMGQLGGDYRSVFFGQNALKVDPKNGRAVMQHNHDVALLDSRNRMIVLGFGKSAWSYDLDPISHQLEQRKSFDSEMLQNAAALFQSAFELYYSDRWFPDNR